MGDCRRSDLRQVLRRVCLGRSHRRILQPQEGCLRMIEVARRYFFHATHYIEGAPQPWCNPHGHDYTVEVVVAGEPDSLGFVIDTDELDAKWVQELLPQFKNQDLTKTLS